MDDTDKLNYVLSCVDKMMEIVKTNGYEETSYARLVLRVDALRTLQAELHLAKQLRADLEIAQQRLEKQK